MQMSGHHSISFFLNHVFTYVMYGFKLTIPRVTQKWNRFKNFLDIKKIIYQEPVRNQNLSKGFFLTVHLVWC